MYIELTTDKSYPIAFDDTYGKAYLHRSTIEDDKEWAEFIAELEDTRAAVLAAKKGK